MSTIENNKLIAEFMGYDEIIKGDKVISIIVSGRLRVFNPNSDWNWLMEVVEKIESFKWNKDVIHWSRNYWTIFDLKLSESKIEATYNAAIDFIKWYNQHSTS